jgi:N,N'-diacetyllegionaminate synthase
MNQLLFNRTYIIAEAGVNHNGSIKTAKKLIDIAADAGADAVKFQSFKTDNLVCESAPKAHYQKIENSEESQYQMLKKLELSKEAHFELIQYCSNRIQFLSSPFDRESLAFLKQFNLPFTKIPSGEITNLPLLIQIARIMKPVILSTGMATIDEIGNALDVLNKNGLDSNQIVILHCITDYPARYQDVNLRAMLTIAKHFPDIAAFGYSDHTMGIEIPIAAVSLGAKVIEKHFTISNQMSGPDHKASLNPDELKAMVKAIRNVETAFGDGVKRPAASEILNKEIVRKSIVASKNILKDDIFCNQNITVKRPGNGLSPMLWEDLIGKKATKSFKKNELISL